MDDNDNECVIIKSMISDADDMLIYAYFNPLIMFFLISVYNRNIP